MAWRHLLSLPRTWNARNIQDITNLTSTYLRHMLFVLSFLYERLAVIMTVNLPCGRMVFTEDVGSFIDGEAWHSLG